ncbi:MAG TPA: M23 family metallopeptidase [Gemmatimonadaceae bacterium]|nr:M23 family metallopeptidase [Gemmatimonadaceae bacterium]
MKPWAARLITYGVSGGLAALAIAFIRPLPERTGRPLADVAGLAASWEERVDSISKGETLGKVLERGGLTGPHMLKALHAMSTSRVLNPNRVRGGMRISFGGTTADSVPRQVSFQVDVDRVLRLVREDSGWTARVDSIPWVTDTVVVRGQITENLYEGLYSAESDLSRSSRQELAWSVANIFEFRIDMSRDVQTGDAFTVLVERRQLPNGVSRVGDVLAATFTNGGATVEAIRHELDGKAKYYDQQGKSLAANFLLAPLEFRRISSNFGGRRHPVLGIFRKHQGTDYAAGSGTPVRAIGDGIVIGAGSRGGYGNVIEVRHTNGIVTRYGHLRGFAKGVRGGTRVAMGQTIGYVGMTGLATGPHLHFEVLVNGVARNPRTTLQAKAGPPLPTTQRAEFDALRVRYLAMIEQQGSSRVSALNVN